MNYEIDHTSKYFSVRSEQSESSYNHAKVILGITINESPCNLQN